MKDTEFLHEYDCDWDHVTSSFWKKYWHPKCSSSRALVINRSLDSQGCLVTKRLHVISQDLPSFIYAIIGRCVTYAGEESIVDPKNKEMILRTKNLSMISLATVDELCVYKTVQDSIHKTEYKKMLSVQGCMYGLVNCRFESWYVDADQKNRGSGISVMDEIIEGVSQLLLPLNNDLK